MAAKGEGRQTGSAYSSFRKTLHDPLHAKTCYFYKDGDYKFSGIKVAVHPKRYRRLEALYAELSNKVRGLPYGVRSIFTPRGRDVISSVEGLQDDGHYICSTFKHKAGGMNLNHVLPPPMWNYKKPPSGQRNLNSMLQDPDLDDMPRVKRARYIREQRMANAYNRSHPKKITVLRNGDPTQRHILLINRRTAQTFDQILSDVSEMFQCAVRKLFTMEGRKVLSLTQLFNGPEVLVAAGKEPFKSMMGFQFEPHPPAQPRTTRSRLGGDFAADKLKNRRDRLMRTKGQWKVWVTTNELSSGGTTAQVTLTAYGQKGQTMPLPLGFGDSEQFKAGHIDEFDISVGSLGELYKIRLAHDNTGDYPSWLCDEVRMRDKDTGEELVFPVKRWLSRDEDDHEICRELPVNRRGEPHLPVIKYEVSVVTGNLWNAGTDANVYLTVYGDRGDTGVRQLFSSNRDHVFNKGQTDHFTVEAVTLGKLKRVIVGHDGTNPGDGWFLEKITIQEPDAKPQDVYTFLCNRWLDEAEDDGKIVRELKVQDEYMDDILSKRNRKFMKGKIRLPKVPKFHYKNMKQWELEKWKFENKNQVMFFSMVTGKALRLKSDGTVDGLGEDVDPGAMFIVSSKKPMVRIFTSLLNASFHLAIDNGKVVGHGRGGPYCEFRIHTQNDGTVMLEGVKSPLQFVSFQDNGKLGDPRGVLDKDPGKRFHVYCKGMLRHRGIIMLKTSNTQAISVDHDLSLFGTGKCNRAAHFRVHKVDSGNIRMFESMISPGKYLRLFDGKIDCQGGRDDKSHFLVEKHRDKGYVTIQSRGQRGVFVGMTPKGDVRPTVDTGVSNIWLYPEVVDFGVSKTMLGEDKLTPISERDTIDTQRSAKNEIMEGDWKVIVQSLENLENGQVSIVVYGDKGHSEPIALVPPVKNGPSFRAGSSDEFKINLPKVGEVYKVRLELASKSAGRSPKWKVGNIQLQDLNTKKELLFRFDRWLSRQEDDGEIMRELPVFAKGKEVLPMRQYEVRVYTGKEGSADTTAAVYINLFGEHGDCGKRMLIKSNNKTPFLKGQVDKFEVEAVSLGELAQCLVGHDGTRSGDGWYLDSIVVREAKNSGREYVFPCNRWLDAGREDRKIERMLQVKETSESKPVSAQSVNRTPVLIKAVSFKEESFSKSAPEEEVVESKPADDVQSIPKTEQEVSEDLKDIAEEEEEEKTVEEVSEDVSEEKESEEKTNTDETTIEEKEVKTEEEEKVEEEEEKIEEVKEEETKEEEIEQEKEEEMVEEEESTVETETEQKAEAADATEDEDITFPTESDEDNLLEDNKTEETKEEEHVEFQEDKEVAEEEAAEPEEKEEEVKETTEEEVTENEEEEVVPEVVETGPTPKPEVGTWRLLLTTGPQADMACLDTVVLHAYGSRGSVGPMLIGKGEDGVFQPGHTDELMIVIDPEQTGKLFKIRVGLAEKTPDAQWFLEKLIMENITDGESLPFQVHRWLSRKHDDLEVCRELPVAFHGETPLPVRVYQIKVHTGDEEGADTDAEVYITLHGERGDSGRRKLFKSKSDGKMFGRGKVDVFTMEAVSLGNLQRLVVGHEEPLSGRGWHLADITVSESATPGSVEYYFSCNRWLDAGKEDGKTELELKPGEKPQVSTGEYQMLVKTASDSSAANGGKVSIIAFGSQGQSKVTELSAPSQKGQPFEPGNIDEFDVAFGNIGEIQKLRVIREDKSTWKAWHLEEIKMTDKATNNIMVFAFDRWFSRDMDDHDLVRELPALKDNKPISKVCQYEVTTFTGDHWAAGTDATAHITLFGTNGDSGKRILYAPNGGADNFRVDKEDNFQVEAVDLGDLTSVVIGHNGKGHGAGWFLDKVVVKVKGGDGGKCSFPCMRWLDDGEDDGKTERELRRIEMPDLLQIAPMSERNNSTGEWKVYVRTSDIEGAATCAQVYLTVYGSKGVSPPLPLGDGSPSSDNFWRGKEVKFQVNAGRIGEIRKIRLEHDNRNPDPAWHVESVRMVDMVTEEELFFPINRWLAEDKDDGQLHREFPVMSPGVAPVPVLRYIIAVQTGKQPSAGASDGWISVNLIGRNGDTGQQLLQRPLSNPSNKMTAGKMDVYMLEAVSVGTLQGLRLVFEGKGKAQKWFVEHVLVLESVCALEEAIFNFNCWLDASGENTKEVPLSDTQISYTITEDVAKQLLGHYLPESEGRWEVTVRTSKESDAGTKDPVMLVLYGSTGHTEPKPLNKDFTLNPDSVVKLQVETGQIGPLFKIRLLFGDRSGNSSWSMDRLKLKDLDTGEEFHFDDPIKVESSPSSPDGATELPAIRPDIAPLPDITYLVKVSTGSLDRADTDAEIFCILIGQWGDSGERVLREPKSHKDPFKKGQTDEFEVKTLQLGHVRKLMIGHNESGRGHGWFCQQVTVQALNAPPPDKKPEVVFLCNRWMDSGCEDRRLVRELIPSGEILPEDIAVDKSLSRGIWRCTVKMATEDELDPSLTAIQLPEQVMLTAYGTRGTAGPLKLQDSNRDLFLLGQTDKFENVVLGGIGNVQKLRLSAGREDDDNPVWMIEQVTLENVDSHEVLHFDFRRWVGEVGGDIHRELPVLVAGQLAPAVLEYEVQVETENAKDAGTNASVFINIYGKNGDSGRRRLVTPRSRVPQFQQGQTNIFLVEAVDVGELQKVVVTKGPGHPWQLNQVKVKAGRFSAVSHIFIWSNTIGSPSEQSEEVSITIPVISTTPAPVAIPIEQANHLPTSGGQWSVETVTSEKGVSGEGTDLVLVLCGDKGESSPVNFLPVQDTPFKPRQTDAGVVHLGQDIGELIKVRMGFADNSKNKSLDIVKIKFEDVDTRDYFHHELSRPLAVDEKSDGWTEFPVVWPAVFVLPVIVYKIEVTTGSVPKGTTDADVFIQLYGRMGTTGRRLLKKSNNEVKFQLGQTDVFELEAVSLMSLDKVLIGHNDATAGKGWFVKKVVVHPQGDEEYVFECNRWFDGGEDDGRIERMLTLNEDAAPTPDVGPAQKAGNKWVVWATTGSGSNQGTSSPVVVVLYGDKGHTEPMLLGDSPDPPVKFTEGQTQQFEVSSDVDVGKVYKVRVGFLGDGREPLWYSDFSRSPSWYLERLKIQEESSGRQYVFEAKRWIRVDQQHDHWKEFPVYTRNEQDMLPVKEYYVEVYTGDANFAGTDANVYLEIFGDRGDTGKRHLHGTKAPGNMFEKKKHDMFIVEAVDLGSLRKVKVSHDGYGAGSGWFLDKITIKESQSSKEKYVFECHKWLDVDEGDGAIERELPLAGLMGDHVDAATDVDWQVRVMTSMCEPHSGTDSKVTLTVFGERGTSGPQPLRPEDGIFHPGQTDNFEITLNPGEIGRIQKIRLEHDNTGKQPDWHVEKVIMNNNLGEEVKFTVDRWLSYNMMNGDFPSDIVCEAPAKWPDQQPLSRYNYVVKTVTPPDPGAGTDATIYINVVGSRGDSGVRELRRNLEQPQPKFQEGLTDSFVLEAVDLGTLEKVIVGLKKPSSGTSWKLQCVLVRVSETENSLEKENYVFPWGKHLDARHPEVEIMLAEVVDDYVEREITGLTPRGSAPHTYRSPREGGITLEHGESSPQASPRTSQTLAPDINRSPRAGGLRMQQGPHSDESGNELEIGEFSARSDY